MAIEPDHGKRLKTFRHAAGLSQRELAQKVGVIHSNINYWENSGKLPKAELLIPISHALGVTVEELLGEPKPTRARVPGGKLGEVFNEASRLPRRQQQKIAEVVEGMLLLHEAKVS
jgi:transcriptional regulator with XRE-family HTH domain